MTGRRSGSKGHTRRYYAVNDGGSKPTTGSVLTRTIPAESLERAVFEAVRETLLNREMLLQTVNEQMKIQQAARTCDSQNVQTLILERDDLTERLRDAMLLSATSRKLLHKDIIQWESRLHHLEGRIATVQAAEAEGPSDPNAALAAVEKQIKRITDVLSNTAPMVTRQLLKRVIPKLVVDLETRAVEMEVAIPEGINSVCVDSTYYKTNANETHRIFRLKIAEFDCHDNEPRKTQPSCFVCHRRAA